MADAEDENKIGIVHGYLLDCFRDAVIKRQDDAGTRRARTIFFRVDGAFHHYSLEIASDYLENRSGPKIADELERLEIAELMRANRGRIIVLVEGGPLVR